MAGPTRTLILCVSLALAPGIGVAQEIAAVTAPVWAKPDHFWYRRTIPAGYVWLNVDARHGVREPLFDHQRLAIELTIRTGVDYTPATLPFTDPAARFVVKYDGSNAYIQEGAMAIEFVHGSDHWRCDLQTKWNWNKVPPTDYECLSRRPASAASPAPADSSILSPDGKWEALVLEHNIAIRPTGGSAPATRLTTDGSAADAYHAGSIQWSADSRTVSAYRVNEAVWLSDSLTGNVKKYIARGEWTVPTSDR